MTSTIEWLSSFLVPSSASPSEDESKDNDIESSQSTAREEAGPIIYINERIIDAPENTRRTIDEETGGCDPDTTEATQATVQSQQQKQPHPPTPWQSLHKSSSNLTLMDHDDDYISASRSTALVQVFFCIFLPMAVFMSILFLVIHRGLIFGGDDSEIVHR